MSAIRMRVVVETHARTNEYLNTISMVVTLSSRVEVGRSVGDASRGEEKLQDKELRTETISVSIVFRTQR